MKVQTYNLILFQRELDLLDDVFIIGLKIIIIDETEFYYFGHKTIQLKVKNWNIFLKFKAVI